MEYKQSRLEPTVIHNFYKGYEHIICSEVLETSTCSSWKCQSYYSKLFCPSYLTAGKTFSCSKNH